MGGHRRLASAFDPRQNSIGALRLTLALGVLVSHSWPLGFAERSPFDGFSRGQLSLGELSVAGFFVLSGFLVTRSAHDKSILRFCWHRFIRIFPAYWACLAFTALLMMPAIWLARGGTASSYLQQDPGPWDYLTSNWTINHQQYDIGKTFSSTPFGEMTQTAAINGSVWSLQYEVFCYALLAAALLMGGIRRAPHLLLAATVGLYVWTALDWFPKTRFGGGATSLPTIHVPVLGTIYFVHALQLLLIFFLGCCAALFAQHIVLNLPFLACASVLALATAHFGGWEVVGVPCFCYVVLYLACWKSEVVARIGRTNDLSYGVFLYAFPIQQTFALIGVQEKLGHPIYLSSCGVLALLAGWASWNVVERPSLKLKSWRPSAPRRGRLGTTPPASPAPRTASAPPLP